MKLSAIVDQLRASLMDSADVFKPEDFQRHIDMAVIDYSRFSPQEVDAEIVLTSGNALYPCPDDLEELLVCEWGLDFKTSRKPWDYDWPGRLPEMRIVSAANGRRIKMVPSPTAQQLSSIGDRCGYRYSAPHLVTETTTTLTRSDEQAVLLRAQAEAMKELAMRGITKPVQMRDGMSQGPKNGTPSFLYAELMKEFTAMVTR